MVAMSEVVEPYPRRGVAWWVVVVLMLCFTLSYVDRQILAFLVGPLKADLGLTDTQVGLLQGLSFAIFYTVLGLPAGLLADRFSRRNVIVIGVVVWSLMTTLSSIARSYFTLTLARMGLAAGEATLNPCAFSLIADYFPKERLSSALSVYTMGIQIGSGLALIIGGVVVQTVMSMPPVDVPWIGTLASWRLTFIVVGIPGLLIALLVLTIREPVRRTVIRNREGAIAPLAFSEAVSHVLLRWKSVLGLSFMIACMSMCNYALLNWGPTFFERVHQWPKSKTGFVLGIITLACGCGGLFVGGRIGDYWQRNGKTDAGLRVALMSLIGAGISLPIAMMMPTPNLTVALIVVAVFFIGLPIGSIYAAVQLIFPNQVRGFGSGVVLFIVTLTGLTFGSLLPGLFNDYLFRNEMMVGYSVALTVAVASVTGTITVLLTLRPYRKDYALVASASIS
jgi:MFS family permease